MGRFSRLHAALPPAAASFFFRLKVVSNQDQDHQD
jgi:hypothetical protein